jgi:hypothetical protein
MSYVTKAELKEMFAEFAGELSETLNKRDRKFAQQFEELQDDIGEAIDGVSDDFLDDLIEEAESLDDDDLEDDEDEYEDDDDYEEEAVTDPRVLRQLDRLQRQNAELQAQMEADREAREAEKEELQYQRMFNRLEQQLQGQVANPRQFLQLLDSEGMLIEEDGQLKVAIEDEYGEGAEDILDVLPDLLDDDDYAHFAPARPGTGTGASQSGQNYIPQHQLRYFKDEAPTGDELADIMGDPEKEKEFFKELDSVYS